jgi:ribosomal protein S18 acetylase RimI-like enzyme
MNLLLPTGYRARPAVREDAEAVLAILHANALALNGETENTLDELLEEWGDPDLDLADDTRVVLAPDGRLIAYAVWWGKGREALPFVDVYLHQREWERDTLTEPALLAWAEARTREQAGDVAPDLRIAMRTFSDVRETRYIQMAERAGYTQVRHSYRMGITFDGPPDPGAWPEGVTVRPAEPGDSLAVFDAFRDAWRDHFGYIERPYEQALESWRYMWEQDFVPGLWLLAMDGDTVAGMCITETEYGGDESAGFVMLLAVRRAYRKRGIAEALLRRSLSALHAAGKHSVLLYVDGLSLTGATRIYERAGMSVRRQYALLEKELRSGRDPSTHEAGQPGL